MSESILHDSERGETQGGLAGVLSWRVVGWLVGCWSEAVAGSLTNQQEGERDGMDGWMWRRVRWRASEQSIEREGRWTVVRLGERSCWLGAWRSSLVLVGENAGS